jgi:glycosyltransferase involved in cell wall biosynthesis
VRLTALVESPEHVCCRYRITAFESAIARAGHELKVQTLARHWWSRLRQFRTLGADVVILQRKLLPRIELGWLRRAAGTLVYDFDDAVFLRDSYSPKGQNSARRLRRFRSIVCAADAVFAGNVFLAEQANLEAGKKHSLLTPTCVDGPRYPTAHHSRKSAGVQLVWIGSSSTLSGLEAIRDLLEQTGASMPGLSLKIICDRFLKLRRLTVESCPWNEGSEALELARADIGVSWLPDDRWSRGKCGLKVLQYMAAGLPVVANPVGVQAAMIRHGENGFLVDSPADWLRSIAALARDPDLRQRMGEAGRQRLMKDYSVESGAARWMEFLSALSRRCAA